MASSRSSNKQQSVLARAATIVGGRQPQSEVEATLQERGSRYGDFSDHARIAQEVKRTLFAGPNAFMLNDVQRQATEVIVDKLARIVCGDPNYGDNWHDIQGYARLVEERLPNLDDN